MTAPGAVVPWCPSPVALVQDLVELAQLVRFSSLVAVLACASTLNSGAAMRASYMHTSPRPSHLLRTRGSRALCRPRKTCSLTLAAVTVSCSSEQRRPLGARCTATISARRSSGAGAPPAVSAVLRTIPQTHLPATTVRTASTGPPTAPAPPPSTPAGPQRPRRPPETSRHGPTSPARASSTPPSPCHGRRRLCSCTSSTTHWSTSGACCRRAPRERLRVLESPRPRRRLRRRRRRGCSVLP